MQWGEGKASLDRVLDNNSGQIKTCLQVIIIIITMIITITIIITINNDDANLQACNRQSESLVTSSSGYPSRNTMPNRLTPQVAS